VWQITGILSFALVLSLAGFKLYYDKVEAEKNQMKSALEQSQKNESLMSGSGRKRRTLKKSKSYPKRYQRPDKKLTGLKKLLQNTTSITFP
jgi:hypothetical protein